MSISYRVRRVDGRSAGVISSDGFGPWLYFDDGTLLLHAFARYFWTGPGAGFRWTVYLTRGDRVLFSRGRG